jgi:hypothetical protein
MTALFAEVDGDVTELATVFDPPLLQVPSSLPKSVRSQPESEAGEPSDAAQSAWVDGAAS